MIARRNRAGQGRRARAVVLNGPTLNLTDAVEMMPGAQPSANSAKRELFSQRCVEMWQVEAEEDRQASEARAVCSRHDAEERYSMLETMFPNLDSELVWTQCQEAPNLQDAVETLLALSSTTSDASSNVDTNAPREVDGLPPLHKTLEDNGTWPTLVGGDGWEVVNYQVLQQDEQDLGGAWCNAAKDAAHLPSPKSTPNVVAQPKRKKKGPERATHSVEEEDMPSAPTDYEMRHSKGKMHAKDKANRSRQAAPNQQAVEQEQQEKHAVSESEDSTDSA